MPKYIVRATKIGRDLLKAQIEVEAANEQEALAEAEKAIQRDVIVWDHAYSLDDEKDSLDLDEAWPVEVRADA